MNFYYCQPLIKINETVAFMWLALVHALIKLWCQFSFVLFWCFTNSFLFVGLDLGLVFVAVAINCGLQLRESSLQVSCWNTTFLHTLYCTAVKIHVNSDKSDFTSLGWLVFGVTTIRKSCKTKTAIFKKYSWYIQIRRIPCN